MWFTDLFIDFMPGYSKFRTVESILVIAEFTIPLLGILGLRELLRAENPWKTMRKPLLLSFGICLFFCALGIFAPSVFGQAIMGERDQQIIAQYVAYGALPQDFNMFDYPSVLQAVEQMRLQLVKTDALRSFLFIAIALIALVYFCRGKIKAPYAVAIVGVAVLVDLFSADRRYLNHDSFVAPVAATPFVASNADNIILADPDPDYRVLDVQKFSQADPSYFHKAIGGYHAAKLTRYQDLIDRHLGYMANPQVVQLLEMRADSLFMAENAEEFAPYAAHLNVLDMLNTKYIITDPNSMPFINDGAYGNAWFVDSVVYVNGADAEMDALDRINPRNVAVADYRFGSVLGQSAPGSDSDEIRLTSYAPDELKFAYKLGSDRVAVFSEVYFPWGWKATVNGEELPIGRVDYLLRAMRLPAGSGEIVMTFRPQSVRTSDTVATIAIVLIYLLLIGEVVIYLKRRGK